MSEIFVERRNNFVLGHLTAEFRSVYVLGEACVEIGAFGGSDGIPHFGLAKRSMALCGKCIVGMYLNRKIVRRIDEFDEQGEFTVVFLHQTFAHDLVAMVGDKRRQSGAFECALRHHGFMTGHRRKLPALANMVALRRQTLELGNTLAAPDDTLEYRIEFKYFHCIVLYYIILQSLLQDWQSLSTPRRDMCPSHRAYRNSRDPMRNPSNESACRMAPVL